VRGAYWESCLPSRLHVYVPIASRTCDNNIEQKQTYLAALITHLTVQLEEMSEVMEEKLQSPGRQGGGREKTDAPRIMLGDGAHLMGGVERQAGCFVNDVPKSNKTSIIGNFVDCPEQSSSAIRAWKARSKPPGQRQSKNNYDVPSGPQEY
jgi:hypothetical protein